jgi:DNA-binding response OmpR family regulator
MLILIVDDDEDQRGLRAMLLSRNGFNAIEAGDKQSAEQLARLHGPDAAIVDLRLPTVEDGLELIGQLKSLNAQMRLIVLTGMPREKVRSLPGADLIDELLVKPTSTIKLVRVLRSLAPGS